MERTQYTVRGVPAAVDAALRDQARASDTSLNAILLEALARAARPGSAIHDDLDWFIGSAPAPDVSEATAHDWLDALPHELRMKLALDTNAYTALHHGVAPGLAQLVRHAERVSLPLTVVGELRFGFLHGSRFTENTRVLESFLATPRVDILPITDETAQLFAEIATHLRQAGTPIQQNDIWIAAACKQQGFALATRDRGFEHVLGLPVIGLTDWA